MENPTYEIRVCVNCGLRYPVSRNQKTGKRCPNCLGEPRVISRNKQWGDSAESKGAETSVSLSVLLDNIRSAWNVGSILRSAEGFGFKHAYLCGITPTPKEESVQKTALGAEEFVTWSYHKDSVRQVIELKEEGWYVWCLEDSENSVPLRMNDHKKKRNGITGEKIVLILGNEVTGVDPGLMELSDRIYSIPMRGRKRSFNVAVAFGIAAFTMQSE